MNRIRGFTLLEVLVAVLLFGSGLLAASSMQVLSLRHTNGGLIRSQATALAHDMAERIRSNPVAVRNGSFSELATQRSYCQTAGPVDCVAEQCSADELAHYDFYQSGCVDAPSRLPAGHLTVSCDALTADPLCTVSVRWATPTAADVNSGHQSLVALRIQP